MQTFSYLCRHETTDIFVYPTVRDGGNEVSTSKRGFVRGDTVVLVAVLPSRDFPTQQS